MLMPVAAAVMLVVSVGFYVGYKSRDGHINDLKEWLKMRGRGK
jgi:hypothetical protein